MRGTSRWAWIVIAALLGWLLYRGGLDAAWTGWGPHSAGAPAPSKSMVTPPEPPSDSRAEESKQIAAAPKEAPAAPAPAPAAVNVDNTKTVPHPRPWPIATEAPVWDVSARVAPPAEKSPSAGPSAAAAGMGIPHPFPWPIATEVPKWNLPPRLAAAAPERAPAPPAASPAPEVSACQDELRRILATGTILFKTASAEIDAKSSDTLAALAEAAKKCARARFRVEGHTDARGTSEKNEALSRRRAEAIVSYLVKSGLGKGSLSAQGFGSVRPVAPNDTEANRARNRRIEITVVTE